MVKLLHNLALHNKSWLNSHELCKYNSILKDSFTNPLTFQKQKQVVYIRPATAGVRISSSQTPSNNGALNAIATILKKVNSLKSRAEYRFPAHLLEQANEYLREIPVPSKTSDNDDWNLNKFAKKLGHSTVLRDESVRFFSNLRLMYSTSMTSSRPVTAPTPIPNLLELEAVKAEQAFKRRPSNLPAYSMPNWYPRDDPFFEIENPLGGMWSSDETYATEMKRVPLRKWESTNLGKLMESDDRSVVGTNGIRFIVMSYNVLSPRLLEEHSYMYKDNDPQTLDFETRCRTFFAEIEHYQPDIIGLQEIDSTLLPLYDQLFEDMGFKGVFKKRTREKNDGCAIYYRDSKFLLVDKLSIEYYQPHVPILDRDNIGLLVKLETKRGRRQKVVVGTTHLLFNPKRHDVKLAQVQMLLAELDRFSFCGLDKSGLPIYHPTIITGDFNTEPYGPISKLITEGSLQHMDGSGRVITPLKRRGGDAFIPPYLGISDQCQHYRVVNARIQCQKAKRMSNFEIETTASNALVNILRSEEYYAEMQAFQGYKVPNGTRSRFDQPSSSTQRSASDESVALDSTLTLSESPSRMDVDADDSDIPSVDLEVLDKIMKHGTLCTFGSGEFTHKFHFRDVHGPKLDRQGNNDGLATTKQNGWVCVDYIYYNMVWNAQFGKLIEGKLKLIRRLGLLNRTQCQQLGSLPRIDIPSDHFPVIAEFLLKN